MTALEFVKQEMAKTSETNIFKFLLWNCREIHHHMVSERRWWFDDFVVVNLGDQIIGFYGASTTGDDSPKDLGWEFDEGSICWAERYEVVKESYRP